MQVWPMYPEDVKRSGGHPCPFPVVLPQRLIKMYTFKAVPQLEFEGDIVLDMFNGTGATCLAARAMGRPWIGIDLNTSYCETARYRIKNEIVDPDSIILQPIKVKSAKNSKQLEFDLNNIESI
jgi:DNA modification methylase